MAPEKRGKKGDGGKPHKDEQHPAAAPGLRSSEEEAFPRGGASALTARERREIHLAAEKEVEKELAQKGAPTSAGKGKKKKKGKAGKGDDDVDDLGHFLGEDASQGPRYVAPLKLQNVTVGMRVWGMVLEVNERGVVVSLPGGLRGNVSPQEASDVLASQLKEGSKAGASEDGSSAPPPLTSLFHIGQFVRGVVTDVGGKGKEGDDAGPGNNKGKRKGKKDEKRDSKKITLSLRLKRVCSAMDKSVVVEGAALPAVVKGVEDHGFTLSLGIKGLTGFLKRSDHEAAYGEGATLMVGGLLDVVVKAAPDARGVVQVSSDPTQIASSVTREIPGLTLDALLPGSMVTGRISAILGDGLRVSFLNFFHGTVDPFHLGPGLPVAKSFGKDQRVRARVLYVEPATKEVGLSLLPHLLSLTLPSATPMLGQVYEAAQVVRVEQQFGVLLNLPLGGELGGTCPAFCHISNVADEAVSKVEKVMKPGGTAKVRVIGFRLLDGIALVTAKPSIVNQQVLGYQDVYPGMVFKATVVDNEFKSGLLVQISAHVKAIVPWLHVSDLGAVGEEKIAAARKKFKEGQEVTGRVLHVDPSNKRMSMTLKPALLNSKLPLIASPAAAAPGAKAHGVVTGVKDYGVFVEFYGGVAAFAHILELGLPNPRTDKPQNFFHLGQVVRCRFLTVEPNTGRIRISLTSAKAAAAAAEADGTRGKGRGAKGAEGGDPCGGLKPGDIVEGVVVDVMQVQAQGKDPTTVGAAAATTAPKLVLNLTVTRPGHTTADGVGQANGDASANGKKRKRGTQEAAEGGSTQEGAAVPVAARLELPGHLADHPAAAEALRPLVCKPGTKIGPLVVLQRLEGQRCVLVSRKASLVTAARAGALPSSIEQITVGAVLPGYVANVVNDAVFVRFAGGVTGRAGLSQLADTLVSDPHRIFRVGQSVRAQVVTLDLERSRFNLTLKPSLTASTDASYAAALFSDLEYAAQLKAAQSESEGPPGEAGVFEGPLAIGAHVDGTVHEVASYGLVVDIQGAEDLVGVVRPHQQPPTKKPLAPGVPLPCRILDVSKLEGIVDLSAAPSLVTPPASEAQQQPSGKKAKKDKKGSDQVLKVSDAVAALGVKPGHVVEGAVVELIKGREGAADGADAVPDGSDENAAAAAAAAAAAGAHVAVLSLPSLGGLLAHVALTDFNAPVPDAVRRKLTVGSVVKATLQVLPSPETGGRLLAAIDLTSSADDEQGKGRKGANKKEGKDGAATPKPAKLFPGALVTVVVTEVQTSGVNVQVDGQPKLKGHIHITEVRDLPSLDILAAPLRTSELTSSTGAAGGTANGTAKGRKRGRTAAEPSEEGVPQQRQDTSQQGAVDTRHLLPSWGSSASSSSGAPSAASAQQQQPEADGQLVQSINPLDGFVVGQRLRAVLLPRAPGVEKPSKEGEKGGSKWHQHHQNALEFSVRPSLLAAAEEHATAFAAARQAQKQAEGEDGSEAGAKGAASADGKGGKEAALPQFLPPTPLASLASLAPGKLVSGVVSEVGDDHLWLSLSPSVRGRMLLLDASPFPEAIAAIRVGQPMAARVLHVDTTKRALDLTRLPHGPVHAASGAAAGGATKAKKGPAAEQQFVAASDIAKATGKSGSPADIAALIPRLTPGTLVMGRVTGVAGTGVTLHMGGRLHGRVAITDIHDAWVPNALAGIAVGAYARAVVIAAPTSEGGNQQSDGSSGAPASGQLPRLQLSVRPSRGGALAGLPPPPSDAQPAPELMLPAGSPETSLKPGSTVTGYVRSSASKGGVFVDLDRATGARIKLSNLSDGFIEDPAAAFPAGMRVDARVAALEAGGRVELTLRTGAVGGLRSAAELEEGEVVSGRVRRIERFGVFIDIAGSSVAGLAHISELSDSKVTDIASMFMLKQAVKAKVLSVDKATGKVSLTLKPSKIGEGEDGRPGKKARKEQQKVLDLDEEMADQEEDKDDDDVEEEEEGSEGEEEEGEEDGNEDGMSEDDDDEEEEEQQQQLSKKQQKQQQAAQQQQQQGGKRKKVVPVDDIDMDSDSEEEDDSDDDDDDEEEEEEEEEEQPKRKKQKQDKQKPALADGSAAAAAVALPVAAAAPMSLGGGLDVAAWGGLVVEEDLAARKTGIAGGDAEDGEEGGAGGGGKGGSKHAKKRAKEEHERQVRAAELARLQGEGAPKSEVEFERAVLASPNSSYTWIRYMAWQLGQGDTDKARAIAQRAIDTIQYREENEKFNVWVAWLNLEATYGTPSPTESLMSLFKKAVTYCEPKKLYFALLGILTRGGHKELEASTLKTMCKKFGGSAKVWLRAIEAALTSGAPQEGPEGAKKTLERALTALPQRKHVKVITGAALLEFRVGSAERGRSLFEGVLRNYPKRLDLWSVYLDQEIKAGDVDRTRNLFERATSLSLPPKRMKFLFKRWLEWEKGPGSGGDPARLEHVKQRALAFVEGAAKA